VYSTTTHRQLNTMDHTAIAAVIQEFSRTANYPLKLTHEGRYESKATCFFLFRNNTKFTRIRDKSYTEMRLFVHQVSFIINKIFPTLRQTLYADALKLFAAASELFAHAVFQLFVVHKPMPSDGILQEVKRCYVGAC